MSKIIQPENFARVCYLVLMENSDGLTGKSPNYVEEKSAMLTDGYDAFGYLDIFNMQKVIDWCEKWGENLPESVTAEWAMQKEAAIELNIMI